MRCAAASPAADRKEFPESAVPSPSATPEKSNHGWIFVAGSLRSFWGSSFFDGSKSRAEDFVDFFRQLEIVIADALHAVRIQVDNHFVPHVKPLWMMVHGFGHQGDTRHVAERRDEILAREFPVQLAVHETPSLGLGKLRGYFGIGKFLCGHVPFLRLVWRSHQPLCGASPAPATIPASPGANHGPFERLERFFVECARKFHYRRVSFAAKMRVVRIQTDSGERREKENSRHPVWRGPDWRIHCAPDAGEAGH